MIFSLTSTAPPVTSISFKTDRSVCTNIFVLYLSNIFFWVKNKLIQLNAEST